MVAVFVKSGPVVPQATIHSPSTKLRYSNEVRLTVLAARSAPASRTPPFSNPRAVAEAGSLVLSSGRGGLETVAMGNALRTT